MPPFRIRPVRLTAIALVAACRPAAPPSPAPPDAVHLSPATTRYALVEHRHVEQQFPGQAIVTDAVTRAVLTVVLDSAPAGFRMEAVLDSVAVTGDAGITPAAVAGAAGARFHADLAPDGAVRAVTGPPEGNPLVEQVTLRLQELVPRLPAGGAVAGATWSDTTRSCGRTAGIPIAIDARARHEGASAWTEYADQPVLPVATVAQYTLAGEGERAGRWVSMSGTGSRQLRRLVTPGGVVALEVRDDTLRVTIELPDSGLRIPLTQVRSDTLRRVDR
jgi:hypothetical protein